ncbi:MAG: hypothetical protein QM765_24265 [Myxococcales bacterium]
MGARWGGALHLLPAPELEGVQDAMLGAYREMGARHGPTASPVLATMLGRQGAGRFDAVVFEAPGPSTSPKGALVFLHGFTGNFTLTCWLAARAAGEAGLMTVCPSVGFDGRWWAGDGPATLEATLRWLERRGIQRVVLGGLSNGANGATVLAPQLAGRLSGLLLVSGGFADQQPPPQLPVLAIHGLRDRMVGIDGTRRYLAKAPPNPSTRLVETPSGHFALLLEREELGRQIAAWLREVVPEPQQPLP